VYIYVYTFKGVFMRANIVDLRYRMRDVLNALNRNEQVVILYHGKETAVIVPMRKKKMRSVKQHEFFGMLSDEEQSVEDIIDKLRGSRYHDI
jgi:antitoxin (DNA-binding transcriptional repressor) of toxin-antitoxin stability system